MSYINFIEVIADADASSSFVLATENFLNNHKMPYYGEIVKNILRSFNNLRATMSIKLDFFHRLLNKLPLNSEDYSNKWSKHFYQNLTKTQ